MIPVFIFESIVFKVKILFPVCICVTESIDHLMSNVKLFVTSNARIKYYDFIYFNFNHVKISCMKTSNSNLFIITRMMELMIAELC